jgi:Domain of unknown function (DUF5615)
VKVRFQADADLNQHIVTGILRREPRVDFQTATMAGLRGLSDLDVLALAAREGRVLVSHDWRTMPQAFTTFVTSNVSPAFSWCPKKQTCLLPSMTCSWYGRPLSPRIG